MPSHPKATDLPALLAMLCDSGVEFIADADADTMTGVRRKAISSCALEGAE